MVAELVVWSSAAPGPKWLGLCSRPVFHCHLHGGHLYFCRVVVKITDLESDRFDYASPCHLSLASSSCFVTFRKVCALK